MDRSNKTLDTLCLMPFLAIQLGTVTVLGPKPDLLQGETPMYRHGNRLAHPLVICRSGNTGLT